MNSQKRYIPDRKRLELCVTYRCNMDCANCSTLCTQAPCNFGDLSVDTIKQLFDDSVAIGYKWDLITVHGGEPFLHREISVIAGMLAEYRSAHNPDCAMQILSNYSTDSIRGRADAVHAATGINLGIAQKSIGDEHSYVAVNESPEDEGILAAPGCFQPIECGICYNYLGFWPCSPMAAAARVFDYISPAASVQKLSMVCDESMVDTMLIHCKHCGFASAELGRQRIKIQEYSRTWYDAVLKYSEKCKHNI